MQTSPTIADQPRGNAHDVQYAEFRQRVQRRFIGNIIGARATGSEPLFRASIPDIWTSYLMSFPAEHRQFHNCSSCRHFIETYGSLVTIDERGLTRSAVWDPEDADSDHAQAVATLARLARRAKVTGVFLSSDAVWGRPVTGDWTHLALMPPRSILFQRTVQTAGQKMAERLQDFGQVMRALEDFTPAVVAQAMTLLDADLLYRDEKVRGPAQWLSDLISALGAGHFGSRDNIVWRAVATAPPGFCHPRTSMIGTLLEDIAAGMDFAEVSRRFAAKMHPLQYQRPQAAPSSGAIAAAEKLVANMGIAPAFARRFARLDEIQTRWRPAVATDSAPPSEGSVFGHLVPKGAKPAQQMDLPAKAVTWAKFSATVLPESASMELRVPSLGSFCALVTAVDPTAPPILQWDRADQRNPVSWYFYHGGSPAERWLLQARSWSRVTAVVMQPSMWLGGDFAHQGEGAIFVLDGAKDSGYQGSGIALFPEILKAELRGIRSVLEAYSKTAVIAGYDQATANGLGIAPHKSWGEAVHLRVTSRTGSRLEYKLDRWD